MAFLACATVRSPWTRAEHPLVVTELIAGAHAQHENDENGTDQHGLRAAKSRSHYLL